MDYINIIFSNGTADRKLSEHYGLWIWLRYDWHNGSNYGVHFNKELDRKLKVSAQERFEEKYGHEKFMQVFKKNYII